MADGGSGVSGPGSAIRLSASSFACGGSAGAVSEVFSEPKHGYGQLAGNTTADAFGSDHVVPILKPQVVYLSGFSVKWYVE